MKDKIQRPLTVREAADVLNLSQACIRSWLANRRLGFVRLGRAIRIPETEIERLLAQGMNPAAGRRSVSEQNQKRLGRD